MVSREAELAIEEAPLGGGRLTAFEASGVSVAGLAPTMAMALGTAFAASEAGSAVPLCYLLAAIGSLALAYVIIRFARKRPGSGLAFTYVDHAFGKTPGFTAGAIYALAWLFAIAVTLAISAVAISSIVAEYHGSVSWYPIFLAELAIALALNFFGVKPSVRVQVVAEIGSMLAVTAIFAAALASPHIGALSWQPFNPSNSTKGWGGIGFGMIYGFSGFAGFEGAAALGFETRNPRKGIPRAVLWSLVGSGVFYLFITYALAIGYGTKGGSAWAGSAAPLATILTKFMGPNWASAVEAMVAVSGFSSGLGLVTLSTRVLHGMSLRGMAPPAFAKEHRRFRTPTVGVLTVCVVAGILGTTLGLVESSTTLIGFMAGFNTLVLIAVYAAIAAGAFYVFGVRGRAKSRWHGIVVPVVAFGLLAYAFYASVIPVPAFPYNLNPYLVLGVAVILLIVGARLRARPDIDLVDVLAQPDQPGGQVAAVRASSTVPAE
ncbi:MAG TPA: APC family permease [Acidimicrobiales bacterium]|jgi:amino acid transporter|nr:APC family permease [Acidimicrobiales bacterium]